MSYDAALRSQLVRWLGDTGYPIQQNTTTEDDFNIIAAWPDSRPFWVMHAKSQADSLMLGSRISLSPQERQAFRMAEPAAIERLAEDIYLESVRIGALADFPRPLLTGWVVSVHRFYDRITKAQFMTQLDTLHRASTASLLVFKHRIEAFGASPAQPA